MPTYASTESGEMLMNKDTYAETQMGSHREMKRKVEGMHFNDRAKTQATE